MGSGHLEQLCAGQADLARFAVRRSRRQLHRGRPAAPPDEPEAAAVLAKTCELLAAKLAHGELDDKDSAADRLDQLCPESLHDSLGVQKLLATVHGVPPSVSA